MGHTVTKFKIICKCKDIDVYDPTSERATATSRVICCPKCQQPGLQIELTCKHSLCENCYKEIIMTPNKMGLLPGCLECGEAIGNNGVTMIN